MTLAAHEWGTRGDVPFVFWHALGDGQSGAEFADLGRVLAGAGFHVLAVDGPGFDGPPIQSYAERLHELLDERELDRPVVSGHSWGGAVALHYAASQPDNVRALVLFAGGDLDDRGGALGPCWDVVRHHEIPTLLFGAKERSHGEEIAAWLVDQGL